MTGDGHPDRQALRDAPAEAGFARIDQELRAALVAAAAAAAPFEPMNDLIAQGQAAHHASWPG